MGKMGTRKGMSPAGEARTRRGISPAGEARTRRGISPAGEARTRRGISPAGKARLRRGISPAGKARLRRGISPPGEAKTRRGISPAEGPSIPRNAPLPREQSPTWRRFRRHFPTARTTPGMMDRRLRCHRDRTTSETQEWGSPSIRWWLTASTRNSRWLRAGRDGPFHKAST